MHTSSVLMKRNDYQYLTKLKRVGIAETIISIFLAMLMLEFGGKCREKIRMNSTESVDFVL